MIAFGGRDDLSVATAVDAADVDLASAEDGNSGFDDDTGDMTMALPQDSGNDSSDPAPSPQEEEKQSGSARKKRLGEQLIDLGLISRDQLDIALQEQRATRNLLGKVLVELGFITESTLGEILAEGSGSERLDLKNTLLDPELIRELPKEVALRHKILPLTLHEEEVQVAMTDVYNVVALDAARRYFPRHYQFTPVLCTEGEILELVDRYYQYELSIDGILREIETGISENAQIEGETQGYTNPTVRLVDALLADAVRLGASDIHFEPEGSFIRLRYRIDGKLEQIRSFHLSYWSAIAVRIKIMSSMNIAETRNPQDGRLSCSVLGREVDFRVSTQPTVHGENIVMRLLDKQKSLVPLDELGYSAHNITVLKKLLKRPEGIIIVTGPTGSGKTTTLYSVLNFINSIDVNIMTLEDPVEYQLNLIRQTNIREGAGVDFASGIKAILRQDPDIIFVGEVCDEQTAIMAVRSALTGHQVYTTLHTNDAIGVIPRLTDIGVPPHMLAGSLIGVVAQRLIRRLCDRCKRRRKPTEEECRILDVPEDAAPMVYEPVGCDHCQHKGYRGRVAIAEVLRIDERMDELIATEATRKSMLEHAWENGFVSMVGDGIEKVIDGITDIGELARRVDITERL